MDDNEDEVAVAGMPRWAKVALIAIGALLVLLFVIMAVSGGDHGPGRHAENSLGFAVRSNFLL